jgi:hypothetical protein
MSHWAELDSDNKVIRILVGDNNDPAGDEGYQWLIDNLGGRWVQTSYNSNFRGTYAGKGYSYNPDEDIFVTPQPYASWIRQGSFWNSPIPKPNGGSWSWDEENLMWQKLEN